MAGEAMNEATKILFRDSIKQSKADPQVILATVKGDIHDIGKNILANFLSGSGISILDLGVDVDMDEIADAISKKSPLVLALSSMLSNTRRDIKKVINELKRRGLRSNVKIIIGGTSTSKVYAKSVGADAYAKDSIHGSIIIKKWVEKSRRKETFNRHLFVLNLL
jgi:5-methyltetrahydrofolate--homocysteine methyltransferase